MYGAKYDLCCLIIETCTKGPFSAILAVFLVFHQDFWGGTVTLPKEGGLTHQVISVGKYVVRKVYADNSA